MPEGGKFADLGRRRSTSWVEHRNGQNPPLQKHTHTLTHACAKRAHTLSHMLEHIRFCFSPFCAAPSPFCPAARGVSFFLHPAKVVFGLFGGAHSSVDALVGHTRQARAPPRELVGKLVGLHE